MENQTKPIQLYGSIHFYSFLCISNPPCECLAVFEAHGSSLNPISHTFTGVNTDVNNNARGLPESFQSI